MAQVEIVGVCCPTLHRKGKMNQLGKSQHLLFLLSVRATLDTRSQKIVSNGIFRTLAVHRLNHHHKMTDSRTSSMTLSNNPSSMQPLRHFASFMWPCDFHHNCERRGSACLPQSSNRTSAPRGNSDVERQPSTAELVPRISPHQRRSSKNAIKRTPRRPA